MTGHRAETQRTPSARNLIALASALFASGASGCIHLAPDLVTVEYDLQVNSHALEPVPGAAIRVAGPRGNPVCEGLTDSRGICRLLFDSLPPYHVERSEGPLLPWLQVTVSSGGFAARVVKLDAWHFIHVGDEYRRAEAIILEREKP